MNLRVPLLCVLLLHSVGIVAAQKFESIWLLCPADLFPSELISKARWNSQQPNADPNWIGHQMAPFGITLKLPPGSPDITVTFEASCPKFMETASVRGTLTGGRPLPFGMSPPIEWKNDVLYSVKKPETAEIVFRVLGTDGAELWRDQRTVAIHSINECLTMVHASPDSDRTVDHRANIAAFVNESHPRVSAILEEAVKREYVSAFLGSQAKTAESQMAEIAAVWAALQSTRRRFSGPFKVSSRTGNLTIQNMRLLDEALSLPIQMETTPKGMRFTSDSNCVDGSVFIASIFMSIGVDCNLVFYPDHCQVEVIYPNQAGVMIETAEMAKGSNIVAAIREGTARYNAVAANFGKVEGYFKVNVSEARKLGVASLALPPPPSRFASPPPPERAAPPRFRPNVVQNYSPNTGRIAVDGDSSQNGVRAVVRFEDGRDLFPSELIATDRPTTATRNRISGVVGYEAEPFSFWAATYDTTPKAAIFQITCTDDFMEPSELRGTLAVEADKPSVFIRQRFFPKILWNKKTLRTVSGLVTATLTFNILEDNTRKLLWTDTTTVSFHSLNECVIRKFDYGSNKLTDVKENLVAYVNEEAHDLIAEIKGVALKKGLVPRFDPNVSDPDEALKEIEAIWTTLQSRDFRYDTIARAATVTKARATQNVRFIDETWKQSLGNCVDASVLLASIFLNIGADCKLVLYPGHCQVLVDYPRVRAQYPDTDRWVIETTFLGDKEGSLSTALTAGKRKYDDSKFRFINKDEGYHIIDVREARKTIPSLRTFLEGKSR